jgi:hypothetical protein
LDGFLSVADSLALAFYELLDGEGLHLQVGVFYKTDEAIEWLEKQ